MYKSKGPFKIIEVFNNGSYSLQCLGQDTGPLLKFHGSALFQLPPCLSPCKPLDTPDLRYLNNSTSPIPNPLQAALDIQLYNERWFPDNTIHTRPPATNNLHPPTLPIEYDVFPTPPFPTIADMNTDLGLTTPLTLEDPLPSHPTAHFDPNPSALDAAIQSSTDRLFFISYCPTGTFRPCWYLIQMPDSTPTQLPTPSPSPNGSPVIFFAKHPNDEPLSDSDSRWWPEWHQYTINTIDQIMDFGPRILFPPWAKPDPSHYALWSDTIHLSHPNTYLFGPFNFASPPAKRNTIHLELWAILADRCAGHGICPPSLSSHTREHSKTRPFASQTTAPLTSPLPSLPPPTIRRAPITQPDDDGTLRRSKRAHIPTPCPSM